MAHLDRRNGLRRTGLALAARGSVGAGSRSGSGSRAGREFVGHGRQTRRLGGLHLGRRPPAHSHGQGAMGTQQRHQAGKIGHPLFRPDLVEVDEQGILIEEAAILVETGRQIRLDGRHVGGLEHQRHHGEKGALEFEACALGLRRRFVCHVWKRKGQARRDRNHADPGSTKKYMFRFKVYLCGTECRPFAARGQGPSGAVRGIVQLFLTKM